MQFAQHKTIYGNLSDYPRLICIQAPRLNVSGASLWFQAGSRYSPPEKEGLPHLFEHLFLSRTAKYPKKQEFLAETERKGLLYSAFTEREFVNYRLIFAPGDEQLALNHLIKAYQTAIITEDALRQEKQIVGNEEKRNRVNPSLYIRRLADQGLWPNSELSRDIFGCQESIRAISLKDIKKFRQKLYQPNNMTIVMVTPKETEPKIIKKIIGDFPFQKVQKEAVFEKAKFSPVKSKVLEYRDIEDMVVSFSYRLKPLSFKERVVMNFIASYLASGWISVLIQKLRLEQALTYWITSKQLNLSDTGFLRFKYTVKQDKVEKTIEIIKEEVNKLRSQKLSQEALSIHKKAILTRILLSLNNPYRMLEYYGQFGKKPEKKIYLFNEAIQITQQLSAKDILQTANEYLDDKQISLAIIGKTSKA